jgi:hypothetical protein
MRPASRDRGSRCNNRTSPRGATSGKCRKEERNPHQRARGSRPPKHLRRAIPRRARWRPGHASPRHQRRRTRRDEEWRRRRSRTRPPGSVRTQSVRAPGKTAYDYGLAPHVRLSFHACLSRERGPVGSSTSGRSIRSRVARVRERPRGERSLALGSRWDVVQLLGIAVVNARRPPSILRPASRPVAPLSLVRVLVEDLRVWPVRGARYTLLLPRELRGDTRAGPLDERRHFREELP